MGELLTQSRNMSSLYLNLVCLFTKFEGCCYAEFILMQILEEYLDIHYNIFPIEGAMMELMTVLVSFSYRATVEG